jgi:methyl-accepting chemotaxis protein
MQHMKLGTKLILGFSAVALITLILGIVGYYGVSNTHQSVQSIGMEQVPGLSNLLTIKGEAERIRGTMGILSIPGLSPEERNTQYRNLEESRQRYAAAFEIYESLPKSGEAGRIWQQFLPAWDLWRAENDRYMELVRKLEKTGVSDPMHLGQQVESALKDHYQRMESVLSLITQKRWFDGGEDHTACYLGKWMLGFHSDNPELTVTLNAMKFPHQKFHEAIKKIKAESSRMTNQELLSIYETELTPALNELRKHFEKMTGIINQAITLAEQAETQILGPVTDAMRKAVPMLNQLVEIKQAETIREVKISDQRGKFVELLAMIAAVLGVALAMGLGIVISRGINRNLTRISLGMSEGADEVASASGQVASASQSMAEGASEQAATIEETSSSMEEMASMTRQNAENAGNADGLMRDTIQVMASANGTMTRLTQSMDEISKASEETSKIIKTIDEIAFQTNLLALNAAVEAARAGEAGAGFAVVADEVRNLAMRAAEAAKNTAQLIEGTVKKVNDGAKLVSDTSVAFAKVGESAEKVGTLVSEITQASREQSGGIDQVNIAVSEMDKVVQQNAATSEQTASAAEEMNAQAEQLREYVAELVQMVTGGRHLAGKDGADTRRPAGTVRPLSETHRSGTDRRLPGKTRSTEVRADQMIPFDDDDDFRNF